MLRNSFLSRESFPFSEEKLTLCTHLSQKLSKKSFLSWMFFFYLCLKCENCVLIERIQMYIWRYREAKISWTKLFSLRERIAVFAEISPTTYVKSVSGGSSKTVFYGEVCRKCTRMSNVQKMWMGFRSYYFFSPWFNVRTFTFVHFQRRFRQDCFDVCEWISFTQKLSYEPTLVKRRHSC